MQLSDRLLNLPRNLKKALFVVLDALTMLLAFWIAYGLRLSIPEVIGYTGSWVYILITILLSIPVFVVLGLYRAVLRYVTAQIIRTILIGAFISFLILITTAFLTQVELPRSVSALYFLLILVLMTASRFVIRGLIYDDRGAQQEPVLIFGAGNSGRQLLDALSRSKSYYVCAFVDDNPALAKASIAGVTVYPASRIYTLIERYQIRKILLAIPHASRSQRQEVIRRLEHLPCEVLAIPSVQDLVDGKISVQSLKQVSINDLLGREAAEPKPELLLADIQGKTVMVTGAGGSIGSELCRQILQQQPKALILFELSEFALYRIHDELSRCSSEDGADRAPVYPLLGSVVDKNRLVQVMRHYEVDTVYHAAAYKHVPLVEYNMLEGIRNNVFGTLNCAQAAQSCAVGTFVLISTDKAVRPTNTMGASKRMAELVLQALAAEPDNPTRFSMVRFGNVLGSSGSVIPLFEQQIAAGGPVTLTHPEITRFFMTIPEAAQLVIQAGAMGKGGDVFVLDMGQSVRILDLARQMIHLSGLQVRDSDHPDGDIEIKITGLRPGEKLYEELLIGENVAGTEHPRIMTATEVMLPWQELAPILAAMLNACEAQDYVAVRRLLLSTPTGFHPKDGICDLIGATATAA